MLDTDTFRALCEMVAEEKNASKLEILKERMRILLADSGRKREPPPEAFVN